MEAGEPTVIPNAEGSRITPSVVGFTKTGERLVGATAKRQAILNPERTVASIKREMGTDHRVNIDGKDYTPEEISAMILQDLKKTAEDYLGEKVERVIGPVLSFDFSKGNANDLSGQGNDGVIRGGKFVDDGGRKLLRLERGDFIDVPSSPRLDPGLIDWYVTVRAKPESPNGILFAQGGESNGYALYLRDSHIILAIRREGKLSEFKSIYPVDINEWSRFMISITDKHAAIAVDAKPVPVFEDAGEVGRLLANPVEGLQIGADTGSHVGSYANADPFVGLIDRVDIYAGMMTPE